MTTATAKIAFIGAGNMAQALVGGLLTKGWSASNITLADINTDALAALAERLGVNTSNDNAACVAAADVVVLAVKPQVMEAVCTPLAGALSAQTLVISIAAGVTSQHLKQWLGHERLVRVMPNTPALIGHGAAGLVAMPEVDAAQKALAQSILESAGLALWFDDESALDAVTATSGSGPAYYFLMMEAMIDAARGLGLEADSAKQLVLQTALGAAQLAQQSDDDPATLRRKVTSPGGTTAAAIASFEASGFAEQVNKALTAARDRSLELSKQ